MKAEGGAAFSLILSLFEAEFKLRLKKSIDNNSHAQKAVKKCYNIVNEILFF